MQDKGFRSVIKKLVRQESNSDCDLSKDHPDAEEPLNPKEEVKTCQTYVVSSKPALETE